MGRKKQEPNVHVWRRSGAGDPGAGAGVGGDYTLQAPPQTSVMAAVIKTTPLVTLVVWGI